MKLNFQPNTIICGDNLDVLRLLNSESIDLIYLDPPFNKKRTILTPMQDIKIAARFKDVFGIEDIKDEWIELTKDEYPILYDFLKGIEKLGDKSNYYYCIYMVIRLLEMHRVLKPNGNLVLHCDHTMSHYLRMLLDYVFEEERYLNSIAWCYKENETATKFFPRKYDTLYWYSKGKNYTFNVLYGEITEAQKKRYSHIIDGKRYANMKGKMRELKGGAKLRDWWNDIPIVQAKERVGYPTQKPLALLDRIISALSNENDIVLDPFCGCSTTCISANNNQRKFIGIDISKDAFTIIKKRMGVNTLAEENVVFIDTNKKEKLPQRTDIKKVVTRTLSRKQIVERKYKEQKGKCKGCNHEMPKHIFAIDHIIPRAKGGTDELGNLQLLCSFCNSSKGTKSMAEFITEQKSKGIYKK